MRKSFLLARSNLRKSKGQTAAIFVLMLLAASMLNLWLMLSTDYKQNFDRYHDKLHAEHVTLSVDRHDTEMQNFLIRTLEKKKQTTEFSLTDSMHMVGSFAFHGGEISTELIFLEKQAALSRSVGKIELIKDSNIQSGIYLPILYQSEKNAIGKTIQVSVGSHKIEYTICGFFNSIMAGSHNCSLCEVLLTEDKYRELEQSGYAPASTLCSIRLKEKSKSQSYETQLKNMVSSYDPSVRTISNSYTLVSQSRYISQMICSGIISAMAFFILLIALIVVASNILNYIQENMKNLGTLKAVGYTGSQLIHALLLQFLGISLAASLLGESISYGMFPFLNTMMISQTGIPYRIHFLPFPFFFTLLVSSGVTALVVWLSSRRIKKVEPIVALRQGLLKHNFKKNWISLETTGIPLDLALALKTTFSAMKQNITVCITMLVLSLIVVFSGLMTENVIVDMTPFSNLIVGETADSCINIQTDLEKAFLQKMQSDPRVEKIYLYHSVSVRHVNGVELVATICDDFAKVNNQDVVFEGRFPKFDNEIAIAAKYAKEHDLNIGDEITIAANGMEAAYLISGYTQTSNQLGKDCLLTRAGYMRLGKLSNASYYLNLSDQTDIDIFHEEIKEHFQKAVNTTINVASILEGSASVYVSLMMMIVITVLVLSVIIIAFVLYLLVRTMLRNKKQDYGILKALGFTTKQLILQTAFSFLPAVILSTIVGSAVCSLIINPLTAFFLNSIGIVKCTFRVPADYIILASIILILSAFLLICLFAWKIRKITPRSLLAGE